MTITIVKDGRSVNLTPNDTLYYHIDANFDAIRDSKDGYITDTTRPQATTAVGSAPSYNQSYTIVQGDAKPSQVKQPDIHPEN